MRRVIGTATLKMPLVLGFLSCWLGAPALAESGFSGSWDTTFGRMTLTQKGTRVTGVYVLEEHRCTLTGTVTKSRLVFQYQEPEISGEGWFELSADGRSFAGQWRPKATATWHPWVGKRAGDDRQAARGFEGLWDTTYGRMRLVQGGSEVQGIYAQGGGSSLAGKVNGQRLVFRYREPTAAGEGWFQLAADGQSFQGKWRSGGSDWQEWIGRRVKPASGVVWLVVVEARWERGLEESEYSFGRMLKTFFARSPNVRVRQRSFTDEASLRRWCGEVPFLAEPAVLVLATHGTAKGIAVDGKVIGPKPLADSLRYARNLHLLHFSACEIMKGSYGQDLQKALDKQGRFPISGYTTSVDWAASAILEFTYLELILARRLTPAKAAEQIGKLLPFAGDKDSAGSVFRAAGFRFLASGNAR